MSSSAKAARKSTASSASASAAAQGDASSARPAPRGVASSSSKVGDVPSLPPHVEELRTRVFVKPTHLEHVNESEDPDAFHALHYDNSFTTEKFLRGLKIRVIEKTEESIVFDLIGVGAPIANALRRILISDVPTMAIDKVILFQNTSIIQDEVLAHRLGLIPIRADPKQFSTLEEGKEPTEENTTVFTLEATCTAREQKGEQIIGPKDALFVKGVVYSRDLKWVPQGSQAERFQHAPIETVHKDIVVAKLRPGQVIEAELHVVKGTGRDHAKWSPVATTYYRQMPDVVIAEPFLGEAAQELVRVCPTNVFDIEDLGRGAEAVVARPRDCTMCRECIADPRRESKIKLHRVRDHFIFTIETAGAIAPEVLFKDALVELKRKASAILDGLNRDSDAAPME